MDESGGSTDAEALLARVRAGDAAAVSELFTVFRDELRRVAGAVFRSQRAGHTLQPTALVNEAFVKIVGRGAATPWQDKAHFLAVAATAMRQILVNHARDRAAQKRGGAAARRVTLSGLDVTGDGAAAQIVDVLDVEEALAALERVAPEQARIVEMRVFAGLSNPEIAEALGKPLRTVELHWQLARRFLADHLGGAGGE